MVGEAEQVERLADSLAAEPGGLPRVSASVAFGALRVAPAMVGFLARYPKIRIDLTITDRWIDLAEGGYDVLIRVAGDPPPNANWRLCAGSCARRLDTLLGVVFLDHRGGWCSITVLTIRVRVSKGAGALPGRTVIFRFRSTVRCTWATMKCSHKSCLGTWGSGCCRFSLSAVSRIGIVKAAIRRRRGLSFIPVRSVLPCARVRCA